MSAARSEELTGSPGGSGAAAPGSLDALLARFGPLFFDDAHHRLSLPLTAAWLHQQGQSHDALVLLDRYWRTGPAGVSDRLLEAAIRRSLRGPAAALPALEKAWALDPTDPSVQRALLDGRQASEPAAGAALARSLLRTATDPHVLLRSLHLAEPDWQAFGHVEERDGTVSGWLVWRGGEARRRLAVIADGRRTTVELPGRPDADWPGPHRLARFSFAWPRGAAILSVEDEAGGTRLRGAPLVHDAALETQAGRPGPRVDVTVVVPVYDDAVATRACLDALLAAPVAVSHRIIAVDDASPDPMIRALLDRLAEAGRIELVRNPHNLGFIRAVNRALARVAGEDVVLLNADTMVPPGWLDRLRVAALRPGVGTVTPLSNNAELFSLPRPFQPAPMPDPALLARLDAAVRARALPPFDVPNGVGFCMYVRNAVLAAVGGLDGRHYQRGYLEEVDFCLRAREAGFRNVCAPDLFVAHAGEKSFGASKRGLVVANTTALLRRWPTIEAETSAFMAADPLAALRGLALVEGLPRGARRRLVISGPEGADRAVWRHVREGGESEALLVRVAGDARCTMSVQLAAGEDAYPVASDHSDPAARLAWIAERASACEILVLAQAGLHPDLPALLFGLDLPLDIVVTEGGVIEGAVCGALLPRVRRVVVPTLSARAAVRLAWPALANRIVEGHAGRRCQGGERRPDGALGILVPDSGTQTFRLVRDLALAMLRRGSARSLVVFGATFRDLGLLRLGNVFVTGPLEDESMDELLALHPCAALFLAMERPLYAGEALDRLRMADLPFAAFPVGGAVDALAESDHGVWLDRQCGPDRLAAILDALCDGFVATGIAPRPVVPHHPGGAGLAGLREA